MVISSYKQLAEVLSKLTEAELQVAINLEATCYKRQNMLKRLHARYSKLRAQRERDALLKGEMVL